MIVPRKLKDLSSNGVGAPSDRSYTYTQIQCHKARIWNAECA